MTILRSHGASVAISPGAAAKSAAHWTAQSQPKSETPAIRAIVKPSVRKNGTIRARWRASKISIGETGRPFATSTAAETRPTVVPRFTYGTHAVKNHRTNARKRRRIAPPPRSAVFPSASIT